METAQRDRSLISVSRKHFLAKSDIRNIKVKVDDRIVRRHNDDATPVTMMVAKLQKSLSTQL